MVYKIKNPNNNEWLKAYNDLITANELNEKAQGLSQFRIIPSIVDPGIADDDIHNFVWLAPEDVIKARLYLWKWNPYFAHALWFACRGGNDKTVKIDKHDLLKVRKDMIGVRSGKIKFTPAQAKKHSIYLANGLFCAGDRLFNDMIYDKLTAQPGWNCYAPQKNLAINDKTKSASSLPIYEGDTAELQKADTIIAVLDGQDLGVATEIGWVAGWNESHAKKKTIIGILTDTRDASKTSSASKNNDMVSLGLGESQYSYINLYTIGAIKKFGVVVDDIDKAIAYIKVHCDK